MSKKLIAVASAAALALTALVGVAPASANVTVVYDTAAATGLIDSGTDIVLASTAANAAAVVDVPSNNSLEYTSTSARKSLIKGKVTAVVGQVVTINSTGGIKLVDAPTDTTNKYTSASGATELKITAATTEVVFYAFTTSTAAGSIKVSLGGNSTEGFLKGAVGPAYNVAVTAPTSVGSSVPTDNNVKVVVTDVFGNALITGTPITADVLGSGSFINTSGTVTLTPSYNDTDKAFGFKIAAATAGAFGLSVKITSSPSAVTGLAKPKETYFASINAVDLAAQVVLLSAQVSALTADYNALATKWNNRLALKKAPKKAATLK